MKRYIKECCGIIVVMLLCLMVQRCGTPPPTSPAPFTGSIRITAMDTLLIDSIQVTIDNDDFGKHRNPYRVDGIEIGTHKVVVADEKDAQVAAIVSVLRDQEADVTLQFLSEGPYTGMSAPKFTAQTVNNQQIDLEQLQGKVVLLAFFEHT